MILAWFAANKSLAKGVGLVLALIALMLAVAWLKGREEADDTHNQAVGAAVEREAVQAETIKNVEKANDAREEIANDTDHARHDQCVRTARTPANCQRFLLLGGQADKR